MTNEQGRGPSLFQYLLSAAVGLPYLLLVELDNVVGVVTRRHLNVFLAHDVAGRPLGELIAARAGTVAWSAKHRDFLFQTDLTCRVDGALGCWEIDYSRPRPWLPEQPFYITPTNRTSARLVPELIPAGLTVDRFPEVAYRAGAIYDTAAPKKAREWLEPWFDEKFPGLISTGSREQRIR